MVASSDKAMANKKVIYNVKATYLYVLCLWATVFNRSGVKTQTQPEPEKPSSVVESVTNVSWNLQVSLLQKGFFETGNLKLGNIVLISWSVLKGKNYVLTIFFHRNQTLRTWHCGLLDEEHRGLIPPPAQRRRHPHNKTLKRRQRWGLDEGEGDSWKC